MGKVLLLLQVALVAVEAVAAAQLARQELLYPRPWLFCQTLWEDLQEEVGFKTATVQTPQQEEAVELELWGLQRRAHLAVLAEMECHR
jgi:hypothetical protein